MPSSSKLKHLSKRSLLFGDKNFYKLHLEIKNVAGNLKKIENCSEKSFTHSFYTTEGYVSQS